MHCKTPRLQADLSGQQHCAVTHTQGSSLQGSMVSIHRRSTQMYPQRDIVHSHSFSSLQAYNSDRQSIDYKSDERQQRTGSSNYRSRFHGRDSDNNRDRGWSRNTQEERSWRREPRDTPGRQYERNQQARQGQGYQDDNSSKYFSDRRRSQEEGQERYDNEEEERQSSDDENSYIDRRYDRSYSDRQQEHHDVRRSELQGEALYGVFPVLNALQAGRRSSFHTLYVLQSLDLSARKDAAAVRALFAAATAAGVPLQKVSRHELNLLSNDRPHQGIVLDCAPLSWQSCDELPPADSVMQPGQPAPVWLALDEVMDPQNLGAILRSAWCLGAAGLLASSKNCAPLSPAVSKASAGAMELATLHACKNMQRTLQDAAAKGWSVLGAAGEAAAVDSATVTVDKPTILVMGNEGYGLRTNIRRSCTGLVKVHMGFGFTGMGSLQEQATNTTPGRQTDKQAASMGARNSNPGSTAVDSLNVSVAAGILLHNLLSAARKP